MRPRVKAYVTMKPVGEGGRPYPFSAGYCPDLRVGSSGGRLAVRVVEVVVSPTPGVVGPGDEAVVRFERVWPERDGDGVLAPGVAFAVIEGDREIATGEVVAGG